MNVKDDGRNSKFAASCFCRAGSASTSKATPDIRSVLGTSHWHSCMRLHRLLPPQVLHFTLPLITKPPDTSATGLSAGTRRRDSNGFPFLEVHPLGKGGVDVIENAVALADLLAAPFDERVVSARLDDLVEVF